MRFLKSFFKVQVLLTAVALISLLCLPESGRTARVAGSDEPVTTVQQELPSPKELPQSDSGIQQTAPAADPARKVIMVTPSSSAVPQYLEVPAPENTTSRGQNNSLAEPEIPVKKKPPQLRIRPI